MAFMIALLWIFASPSIRSGADTGAQCPAPMVDPDHCGRGPVLYVFLVGLEVRMNRRTALALGLAAASVAVLPIASRFHGDLARANLRVKGRGNFTPTRFGPCRWAEAGAGPPVLMLHGSGGGFDQGLLMCRRLAAAGWRILAPSRFGYPGTAMPPDPSAANQADALVDLLDALGIERLPVMGGSAGAIPAIEFAIRHPERCSALVALVPASHVPGRPPMRPNALGAAIMRFGLRSDFLFWAGTKLTRDAMYETLLATDPALIHTAPPEEQARATEILDGILPVSARADGLLNDASQAGSPRPQALEQIAAPTLAIACEDDRFLTHDAALHIAATVPRADLLSFPTGGHILIGHDAEVFARIDRFLRIA